MTSSEDDASGLDEDIYPGDRVALHGLARCPALNGRRGSVVEVVEHKERFQIRLDDGASLLVKPENIKIL